MTDNPTAGPEALLRMLTGQDEGGRVLVFGRDALALARQIAPGAEKFILVERPGAPAAYEQPNVETHLFADWGHLPFSPASVDLAVIPRPARWPADQRACDQWLAAICTVLRSDGELLCIVPNRFSHRRLRKLIRSGFSVQGEKALSPGGVGRLLARAGLKTCEFHAIRRTGSRMIHSAAPLGQTGIDWSVPRPAMLKQALRRLPVLSHEFLVRAAGRALRPALAQRILEDAGSGIAGGTERARVTRLFASAKGKAFMTFVSDGRAWVVRVPFTDWAAQAAHHHATMLQLVRERMGEASWLPNLPVSGRVAGHHYWVESSVPGVPLRQVPGALRDVSYVRQLESLLCRMNSHCREAQTVLLDGDSYDRLVTSPLKRVVAHIQNDAQAALTRFFESRLRGTHFVPGITQGDLSISNIFLEAGQISGVIDWDDGRPDSVPVLDAINHLVSRELGRLRKRALAAVLRRLAFETWPVPEEVAFLDRMYAFGQVDRRHHAGLVYLNWLHVAAARLTESDCPEEALIRFYVDDVIEQLRQSGELS